MSETEVEPKKVMSWIDFGIFPESLMLTSGFSYDEIMALLKKKRQTSWAQALRPSKPIVEKSKWLAIEQDMIDDKTGDTYKYYFIIIKDPFDFSDMSFCTLAHEVLHIVQFNLVHHLDRNKEIEAEAYLHTHLMKQCLVALRK